MIALCLAGLLGQAPAPRIQFHESPEAGLYGTVRAYAADPDSKVPSELQPAVDAVRKLEAALPDRIRMPSGLERTAKDDNDRSVKDIYWQFIDSTMLSESEWTALPAKISAMPDTIGGYFSPQASLISLDQELGRAEASYEALQWPKDKRAIDAQVSYWNTSVERHWTDIYGFLESTYGIEGPPASINVFLVPRLPGKGGVTLRGSRGPFVVVGVDVFKRDGLAECVIHEAIHALEASSHKVAFLSALRAALRQRHADAFTQDQLPHTTFFLTAAEATRRFVDRKHRDLGETLGTYKRGLDRYRGGLQPILSKLWDGKITPLDAAAAAAG